ncbi:MAG TPA: hypothetical protein VE442_18835 [Jatrophihabitans sp.]|nr:hypothetical protein [Jatrophihabitans sp.]
MIVAVFALVVAMCGTATAAIVAHSGDALVLKRTLSGNRLRLNTVTGAEIAESKLGTVPKANLANHVPALVWHNLTLANGWSVVIGDRTPAYAVDAQGIVHLRGAMCCGTTNQAFSLPTSARPGKTAYLLAFSQGAYAAELVVLPTGEAHVFPGGGAPPTSTTSLTSLEGVTFAAS